MFAFAFAVATFSYSASAQIGDKNPESYKLRIDGLFWQATPVATLSGSASQVPIDFNKSFGFDSYSTFTGGVDWHFARKHHLLLTVSPNKTTRTAVLAQTISFKDETFLAGSSVSAGLQTYSFAPGYRYDIVHGSRGHLGITAQINLLDIKASLHSVALQPGSVTLAGTSGSVFAPLPVLGPDGRVYFAKSRIFVDANLKGMSFFGYGNFISTQVTGGAKLGHRVSLIGGYQMGSRLAINGTSDRISARITQRGPTAGLEFTF